MTFKLDEALLESYERVMLESASADLVGFDAELQEAQIETEKTLDLLAEFYALEESALQESIADEPSAEDVKKKLDRIVLNLTNNIVANSKRSVDPISDEDLAYKPTGGSIEVPNYTLKDFLKPSNILVLIKSIANWIKNKLIYFIAKLINIVKNIFGIGTSADKDKLKELKEKAKFMWSTAKKIEAKGTALVTAKEGKYVSAIAIDSADPIVTIFDSVNAKEEGDALQEGGEPGTDKGPRVILSIDISKDLLGVKQLLDHFLKLADEAFGSYGEQMFGTEDLDLLFRVIESALSDIESGKIAYYEIGGVPSEIEAISPAKARDNLINTKLNTDLLRKQYTETAQRVRDLLEIIGHKEMRLASQAGIAYKMFSKGTYLEISEIIEVIEKRLKDMKDLEKDLKEVQKKYAKVVDKLNSLSQSSLAVTNMTFSTNYQKRIANLLDSTKQMTQIVTLRLTAVSYYIREIQSITVCLNAIADFSEPRKNIFGFEKKEKLLKPNSELFGY